jgi:sugar lactone lactonase YvrE
MSVPELGLERASVLVDGTVGEPRLSHPEGIAVAADGSVYCGGDTGALYRVPPDGSRLEQLASTGGFVLGVALDGHGHLFACDLAHRAVFRLELASGALERFSDGDGTRRMRIPNAVVVDARRGCLYVSDSHDAAQPGPGVWRIDLDGEATELWYGDPLTFANGMALSLEGDALYVVETWAQRVTRIPIAADGSPGAPEPVVEGLERVPDGIALDAQGRLYVACYEPSRLYRVQGGQATILIEDPTAHLLCHPTNCAFRGTELLCANLGRWHLTRIEVGVEGAALPG